VWKETTLSLVYLERTKFHAYGGEKAPTEDENFGGPGLFSDSPTYVGTQRPQEINNTRGGINPHQMGDTTHEGLQPLFPKHVARPFTNKCLEDERGLPRGEDCFAPGN